MRTYVNIRTDPIKPGLVLSIVQNQHAEKRSLHGKERILHMKDVGEWTFQGHCRQYVHQHRLCE